MRDLRGCRRRDSCLVPFHVERWIRVASASCSTVNGAPDVTDTLGDRAAVTLRSVDTNTEREELLRAVVAADLAFRPERESFRVQRLESHAGALVSHSAFERLGRR
jgi:hypothetical protein